jgi:hypothetical protein
MARRTLAQKIAFYETRRDNIEAKLESHESYKSIKAQGTEGAETDFVDPVKLNTMLNEIENKLSTLYNQQRVQS